MQRAPALTSLARQCAFIRTKTPTLVRSISSCAGARRVGNSGVGSVSSLSSGAVAAGRNASRKFGTIAEIQKNYPWASPADIEEKAGDIAGCMAAGLKTLYSSLFHPYLSLLDSSYSNFWRLVLPHIYF
jgi:hypothetical protein